MMGLAALVLLGLLLVLGNVWGPVLPDLSDEEDAW